MRPQDPELAELLRRFVTVRIVDFKNVDMNRFQFDYDLTFALLMMDADGRTYSRFGTNDWKGDASRMSIAGLKQNLRDVLTVHARRPKGAAPAGEGKPFTLQDIPAYQRSKQKDGCAHCHYANNFRFAQLRSEGRFRKEMLFQHPHPETIGISLEVDRNNVVRAVLPGSPASRAGVQPGDAVVGAEAVPVFNSGDLQFALNAVPDPGEVTLQLSRGGKTVPARLSLPPGWRKTDISWRPSQGGVPPMVGIWAAPLKEEEKRQRGIGADRLALRVNFFFPGPKWAGTRGDLRMSDIITGVDGETLPHMTTRQFHSYFRLRFNVGDRATLNVLRGNSPVAVTVPCLDVGEE